MSYLQIAWCWFSDHLQDITLIATLVVLWRTMKAAERQSEGSFKPVLTLRRQHTKAPGEDDEELMTNPLVPFVIVNVGTGPALMVKWRFVRASGGEIRKGEFSHIRVTQGVNTHLPEEQLGSGKGVFPVSLECVYRSASGVRYRSITKVEKPDNLIIADFDVKTLNRWFKDGR